VYKLTQGFSITKDKIKLIYFSMTIMPFQKKMTIILSSI